MRHDTNMRHNFIVNVMDAAFFGLGMGFASYVTVLPLFVGTLTSSTLLIGLIATIHEIGWQLPQILTSARVSRLPLYRRMVLLMTLHERWPFLALAIVALLATVLDARLVLILTLIFTAWQSLGGGLTATAWQSMIGKIMPATVRGRFFGLQSSASNLLTSGGAVLAGILLGVLPYPYNFAACFGIASVGMAISFAFLAQTREQKRAVTQTEPANWQVFRREAGAVLRDDANFRWFILARILSQFARMAIAFYTIYATRTFDITPEFAGIITGILSLTQMFASPVVGWLGDRFGHRLVLAGGMTLMVCSVVLAITATTQEWFYVIFALTGMANAVQWTSMLAITVEFGTEENRAYYIGLSNTIIAPATLIAPLIGGWLADTAGFASAFSVSIVGGILAIAVLLLFFRNPVSRKKKPDELVTA